MKTVNHEYYVSLEVAKLLKQAGFDWKVRYMYRNNNPILCICTEAPYRNIPKPNKCPMYWQYAAPSLDVAQRWFMEVKKMCIVVFPVENRFTFIIVKSGENFNQDDYILEYNTSEEAQEEGIKRAVELILEKGE